MGPRDHDGLEASVDDEAERIKWNRWFEIRAADGHGVWPRGAAPDAKPLAMFDDGEEGFEAADREYRRRSRDVRLFYQVPTILAWVVAIGAAVYVGLYAWETLWYLNTVGDNASGSLPFWVQALIQFAYALWLSSLGIMAMLWLVRRAREERRDG